MNQTNLDLMATAFTLTIEIPGLPKITSNGSHGHWRKVAAEKKKWRALTAYAIGHRKPKSPLQKAKCTFTRFSSVQPDFDNLGISFKAARDQLVTSGIVVDDSPDLTIAKNGRSFRVEIKKVLKWKNFCLIKPVQEKSKHCDAVGILMDNGSVILQPMKDHLLLCSKSGGRSITDLVRLNE